MEHVTHKLGFALQQIPFMHIFLFAALLALCQLLYNAYIHPLARYPGPFIAGATSWWKTYVEVFRGISMPVQLKELHEIYGDIIRIGPNELHFSKPSAYHDIYNNSCRWDKENTLYRSFGVDETSFGYRRYHEARDRKNVLQPLFSRRSIVEMQDLVHSKINHLCSVLSKNNTQGKSSDLFMGLRCFTVDTITSFSFARSVDAMDVPEFCAPIVQAMEDSILPMLVFRHFSFLRTIIMGLPPWLSVRINPDTAALVHMRQMLVKQVTDFSENPHLLNETPHKIIYHELMRPGAHKGGAMPTLKSLYEEAQVMVFAGADTVGNTLMMGIFNVLEQPDVLKKLKAELLNAWPDLNEAPRYQELEKLPYLTAVIKESLRISPGVPTPLPRIVPSAGATISSKYVPGGTIVGMSTTFIHNSEAIFKDAMTFNPDRWLGHKGQELDQWLVPFSTGPRSCLGMNLAWCELYIGFATLFRKFDMKLDGTRSSDLSCRDCFLPRYTGRHLRAFCEPVKA